MRSPDFARNEESRVWTAFGGDGFVKGFMDNMWKNRAHIVMALPAFLVLLFIMYVPMAGLVMAFKAFDYSKGIFGSPWNGIENFKFLVASKGTFVNMTRNTVLYYLLFTSVGTVLNVTLACSSAAPRRCRR